MFSLGTRPNPKRSGRDELSQQPVDPETRQNTTV